MTILTGVLYPLVVTGIAQLTMKTKADGSFIFSDEKIVGSKLISQQFEGNSYFWPRPSAVNYNPMPSGGSNLGPTNLGLKKQIEERKQRVLKADPSADPAEVPSELLYASGSGLDPHITIVGANFQIPRIAKARKIEEKAVKEIVEAHTYSRLSSFLGERCVNVLEVNLALDRLQPKSSS